MKHLFSVTTVHITKQREIYCSVYENGKLFRPTTITCFFPLAIQKVNTPSSTTDIEENPQRLNTVYILCMGVRVSEKGTGGKVIGDEWGGG